jgi:DNA repair and recombination protein RAD52
MTTEISTNCAGRELATGPFSQKQIEMMNTPLRPDEISVKQGAGRYIESYEAIKKANQIFGPGNWGYTITSPFEVIDTGATTKNNSTIYRVRVQITLEVRGCLPITDIGDCEANGTTAQAMGMAEKGAVSDGVKRCLRIYGPAFGLDLYDKDWKPEPEQSQPKPALRRLPSDGNYPDSELGALAADYQTAYDGATSNSEIKGIDESVKSQPFKPSHLTQLRAARETAVKRVNNKL